MTVNELLVIANEYEVGTAKCVASGYEEYGPEFRRKRRLIIDALRSAAQPIIIPSMDRDVIAAIINDRTMVNDEGFVQNSEAVADAILALSSTQAPAYCERNDLGIVLSALRYLEEATGERFDDEGGIIEQIERDYSITQRAWQPIETAPFKRTVFLSRIGEGLCVTAYRFGPIGGWRHAHSSDKICFEPTHWMDLPKTPVAS